eukprot:366298-Chlamydomonas_euryale.AAC.8
MLQYASTCSDLVLNATRMQQACASCASTAPWAPLGRPTAPTQLRRPTAPTPTETPDCTNPH